MIEEQTTLRDALRIIARGLGLQSAVTRRGYDELYQHVLVLLKSDWRALSGEVEGKPPHEHTVQNWFKGEARPIGANFTALCAAIDRIAAERRPRGSKTPSLSLMRMAPDQLLKHFGLEVGDVIPAEREALAPAFSFLPRNISRESYLRFEKKYPGAYFCYRLHSSQERLVREVLVVTRAQPGGLECELFQPSDGHLRGIVSASDHALLIQLVNDSSTDMPNECLFVRRKRDSPKFFAGIRSKFGETSQAPTAFRQVLAKLDDRPGTPSALARLATEIDHPDQPRYARLYRLLRENSGGAAPHVLSIDGESLRFALDGFHDEPNGRGSKAKSR